MIRTKINVKGLSEVIKATTGMKKFRTEADKIMEDIVRDTVSLIMRYAAVDTGEMMESVHYEKEGDCKYIIYVDSPHALYNEFGLNRRMPVGDEKNPISVISTSGKSAYRPFVRPAIWQMQQIFPEYLKNIRVIFKG